MDYINYLTKKDITSTSSPEFYSDSFEHNGAVSIKNVDVDRFNKSLLYHVLRLNKNSFSKEEAQTIREAEFSEIVHSHITLESITKPYIMNPMPLRAIAPSFVNRLTDKVQQGESLYTLTIHGWKISFFLKVHETCTDVVMSEKCDLPILPEFLSINEKTQQYKSYNSAEARLQALFQYPDESRCPCLQDKTYKECCKKELFVRGLETFGVAPYSIIEHIKENFEVSNPLASFHQKKWIEFQKESIENKWTMFDLFEKIVSLPLFVLDEEDKENRGLKKMVLDVEKDVFRKTKSSVVWFSKDRNGVVTQALWTMNDKQQHIMDYVTISRIDDFYQKMVPLIHSNISLDPERKYLEMRDIVENWHVFSDRVQSMVIESLRLLIHDKNPKAACYILLPQVEAGLRYLVQKMNQPIITKHGKFAETYLTLSNLIDTALNSKGIEDTHLKKGIQKTNELFKKTLTQSGTEPLNLRNDLLHGLAENEYSEYEYYIVFYLLYRLNKGFDLIST